MTMLLAVFFGGGELHTGILSISATRDQNKSGLDPTGGYFSVF